MGTWAATVRFTRREEAQAFLGIAREAGAYAMLVLEGDAGEHVTVLGEPATLDSVLGRAGPGRVIRREPLG